MGGTGESAYATITEQIARRNEAVQADTAKIRAFVHAGLVHQEKEFDDIANLNISADDEVWLKFNGRNYLIKIEEM